MGTKKARVRNEQRTGHARAILLSALALVVFAVLVHLAVVGLFGTLYREYLVRDAKPDPIQMAEPHRLPPEPRLQPDPVGDLKQLRQREDDALLSYGWVDKQAGVARIPVERALELAAQKGLPQFSGPMVPRPGTTAGASAQK